MDDEQQDMVPVEVPFEFPNDPSVPDIYADGFQMHGGPFGFALIFTLMGGNPAAPRPVAVIRVSPQFAYVLGKQISNLIDQYHQEFGEFRLPQAMLEAMGLTEDE